MSMSSYDVIAEAVKDYWKEMAEKIGESVDCEVCKTMHHSESGECPSGPHQLCVNFWFDWLKKETSDGE